MLYSEPSLVDWIIRVKTWSDVAHVEVYIGDGKSVASRNGIGVNKYALRKQGLAYVLRPKAFVDMDVGLVWFNQDARGEKYDWLGLICFTLAVKQGSLNKMFCSEFAKRFYDESNFPALHSKWDADKTAPGNFLMSPNFDWIWKRER